MAALRSKAAILLARNGMPQAEKALRLNVARNTIGRWELGHTRPPLALRPRVREVFGIPESCWELLPEDPDPPGMPVVAVTREPMPAEYEDDEELGAGSASVDGRVIEVERALRELMREVRDSQGSTPRERATVLESVTRTLGQIARMRGTYELGARLFKLPVYSRWKLLVLEALKPWPEAMRAVAEACRKAGEQ